MICCVFLSLMLSPTFYSPSHLPFVHISFQITSDSLARGELWRRGYYLSPFISFFFFPRFSFFLPLSSFSLYFFTLPHLLCPPPPLLPAPACARPPHDGPAPLGNPCAQSHPAHPGQVGCGGGGKKVKKEIKGRKEGKIN